MAKAGEEESVMRRQYTNQLIDVLNDFVSMTSFHDPQYDSELDIPVDCGCEFCQLRSKAIDLLNKVGTKENS